MSSCKKGEVYSISTGFFTVELSHPKIKTVFIPHNSNVALSRPQQIRNHAQLLITDLQTQGIYRGIVINDIENDALQIKIVETPQRGQLDTDRINKHIFQLPLFGTSNCTTTNDYDPDLKYPSGDVDQVPQQLEDAVAGLVTKTAPNGQKNSLSGQPLSYYTTGNTVYNQDNIPYVFRGISSSGLQYDYQPESIALQPANMALYTNEWKANTLRIPISPVTYIYGDQSGTSPKIYKQIIDTILCRAFAQGFTLCILDIHYGGGGFQADQTHYDCYFNILKKYKNINVIAFEPLNEFPVIDSSNINQWYFGLTEGGKKKFYGVKDFIAVARSPKTNPETFTTNLLIFGGTDYSYQLAFLNPTVAAQNPDQRFDITTVIQDTKACLAQDPTSSQNLNIIFNSHPYGYKGIPDDLGVGTKQVETTTYTNSQGQKYTGPKNIPGFNLQDPKTYNQEMGWTDSFLYLTTLPTEQAFPIFFTEYGLNGNDTVIEGGWYSIALQNSSVQAPYGTVHFTTWAIVPEGLQYPSLLTGDCVSRTGTASTSIKGPATTTTVDPSIQYGGPGVIVYNILNAFPPGPQAS